MIKNTIAALLLSISNCYSQNNNFLDFKILSMYDRKPVINAALKVTYIDKKGYFENFSEANGILHYDLAWLRGDSALLSLQFAGDTLTEFNIYKNKIYGYDLTIYVNMETFKQKMKLMRGKAKKGKLID